MSKIDKLLAVLDMTKEEQWEWLEKKFGAGGFHSFPTLAFRLRDEALFFVDGAERLHKHLFPNHTKKSREENAIGWLANFGKPIHFIITALIAKELAGKAK